MIPVKTRTKRNAERGNETMAASNKTKGFDVCCPHCGAEEALKLDVTTMAMECNECGEPVSKADLARGREKLEKQIAESLRLAAWLDLAATV
jgi:uncharacterized protein (DUF983 family)